MNRSGLIFMILPPTVQEVAVFMDDVATRHVYTNNNQNVCACTPEQGQASMNSFDFIGPSHVPSLGVY